MAASNLFKIVAIACGALFFAQSQAQADVKLTFSLSTGPQFQPEYFGSNESRTDLFFGFKPHYVELNNGWNVGNPDPLGEPDGWSVIPSFNVIGKRDSDTYSELDGLAAIDPAYEFGARVAFSKESWKLFGTLRRGFGGYEGFVGQVGFDMIAHPTDKLRISGGPRAFFGDNSFADTYFSVNSSEAANSRYNAYNANGGLVSAGVALEAWYQLNPNWGIIAEVEWNRYQSDAADSPIVQAGSHDETRIQIGVRRVIRLNF